MEFGNRLLPNNSDVTDVIRAPGGDVTAPA
jgi:hypothetical protein